jgi:PKD repeat protein
MKRFAKVKTNRNIIRWWLTAFAVLVMHVSHAQFSPDSVPNLITWLSADTLVTYDASFFVSLWEDRSDTNDCSQGNPAWQPVYVPSEVLLNGKPSIHFSNSRLNFTSTVIPLQPFSVFIVCRQNVNAPQAILSTLAGGDGLFFRYKGPPADSPPFPQIRFFSGGLAYDNNLTAFQDTNFTIYSFHTQASSSVSDITYLNINQQALPGSIPIQLGPHDNNLTVGSLTNFGPPNNPVIPLDGNIAEILIYTRNLTTAEINNVEMYLRNKYAPPVDLGADTVHVSTLCDTTLDAGARFISYRWYTTDDTTTLSTVATVIATRQASYIIETTDVFGFTSRDTIMVDYGINQLPLISTLCLNDSLLWNTNLSSLNHTFLWSTSQTTSSIYIHSAGQYWVRVTDSFSCIKTSDTITVVVDSFPVMASLGPDATLCAGNAISLFSGAAQAQTYLWSDSTTGTSMTVQSLGTYWVSVTDSNNCIARDSITISIAGVAPSVNFSALTVCEGDTTFFTDLTPAIDTAVAWSWNFGEPSSGANNFSTAQNTYHIYADSGTYLVTLSDTTNAGCYNDTTITITVNPNPVPSFTDSVPCSGMPLQFTNTTDTVGRPVTSWQWNFGDPGSGGNNVSSLKNPSHTFNASGNYNVTLTVTLNNGCSVTDTGVVLVGQAIAPVFSFFNTCIGQVTNFFTPISGASLFWDFGDNSFSTQQNPLHQYAFAQAYNCTLTVITMAGCTTAASQTVNIHELPVANFRTSSACVHVPYQLLDSSYISQGSITQWQWSFPDFTTSTQQNPYYTFVDTLQYSITLVATSNSGCKDTVTRPVKVHPVPAASFISDVSYGDAPLHVNFTNLSAGAAAYAWDFGDTSGTSALLNPSYTYTALGTYPVTLIANTLFGCTDTTVKYIFVLEPILDLAVTSVSKSSGTNSISITAGVANLGNIAASSFKISAWVENSLPVFENWSGSLSPQSILVPAYNFAANFEISQVNPPHFLCVEITDVNGQQDNNPANNIRCINLIEDFVIIDPYPNPAEQVINLQVVVTRRDFLSIAIYDASGKLVRDIYNGLSTQGLNKFILDTSSLANGTYFCKYTFSGKTTVKPLTHISKKK